jgi:uncharacterized protein YdaU (DUF1376 family)
MHYYSHHIGDFQRDTASLSDADTLAYLRLLWMYYDTEQPLPNDPKKLAFRIGSNSDAVQMLLEAFFSLENDVWNHKRCDAELAMYRAKSDRARNANEVRWQSKRDLKLDPNKIATNNQEPITIVEAKPKQSRGTRLPADWKPSEEQTAFCKTERPDLHPVATGDRFRDFWIAQAGSKGVKLDWDAVWRNWVRNEKAGGNKPQQDKPGFFMGRKLSGGSHG